MTWMLLCNLADMASIVKFPVSREAIIQLPAQDTLDVRIFALSPVHEPVPVLVPRNCAHLDVIFRREKRKYLQLNDACLQRPVWRAT